MQGVTHIPNDIVRGFVICSFLSTFTPCKNAANRTLRDVLRRFEAAQSHDTKGNAKGAAKSKFYFAAPFALPFYPFAAFLRRV